MRRASSSSTHAAPSTSESGSARANDAGSSAERGKVYGRAASAPAVNSARAASPVVFAESAPADLVPPSRAAPAPLARAYSMAPQTSPPSLKRANKGGAESSDESPRKRSKQPLPSLAE